MSQNPQKMQFPKNFVERSVSKDRLKVASDDVRRITSRRLFQVCGPATAKPWLPVVEKRVAATMRSVEDTECTDDAMVPS